MYSLALAFAFTLFSGLNSQARPASVAFDIYYPHANYPRLSCNVQNGINGLRKLAIRRGVPDVNAWGNGIILEGDEKSDVALQPNAKTPVDIRRDDIGCGDNNFCSFSSGHHPGHDIRKTWGANPTNVFLIRERSDCDKFPPAGTHNVGFGSSMCVPKGENRSAGQRHKVTKMYEHYSGRRCPSLSASNGIATIQGYPSASVFANQNNPFTGKRYRGLPRWAYTDFTNYNNFNDRCCKYFEINNSFNVGGTNTAANFNAANSNSANSAEKGIFLPHRQLIHGYY
ncbi:hypothetical protein K502DRAFT_349806 [Neoconidiobolus thromboides FSU 785]|nr:hypothetical protein K502DRAFT_349806 [Neoconidiobolus thromboides FSU 785]